MKTTPPDYWLETLIEAKEYIDWVDSLICQYLSQSILEFGAGIGNFTSYFLRNGRVVLSINIDEQPINLQRQGNTATP